MGIISFETSEVAFNRLIMMTLVPDKYSLMIHIDGIIFIIVFSSLLN